MSNLYSANIELQTIQNNNYRRVVNTTPDKKLQIVLMSLKPSEEIGNERHEKTVQFIRIEKGKGVAIIDDQRINLSDGSAIIIPANTLHNIINTGNEDLKLYTIYTPAEHPDKLIEPVKNPLIKIGGNIDYYQKYMKYKNKYIHSKTS